MSATLLFLALVAATGLFAVASSVRRFLDDLAEDLPIYNGAPDAR